MSKSLIVSCVLATAATLAAQAPQAAPADPAPIVLAHVAKPVPPGLPDLSKTPTLFVVGYAHLDTQWRWDYPLVINQYLKATLDKNFALFQKYPHYIFNFTGSNRYGMFKEYYPRRWQELKKYVAEGRWFPAGASVEENDVNSPNAESILRQVLYGNEFFRREFGKASVEYMLPDCFGFPASLPSILNQAGIIGFSTQKLNAGWQPAPLVGGPNSPEKTPEGIPFNVGVWTGPDGKSIIAALNPSSYDSDVTTDLSNHPMLDRAPYGNGLDPVTIDGKVTGIYDDYHYVGTGDIGGSPREASVKLMEGIMDKDKMVLPVPRHYVPGKGMVAEGAPGPAVQLGEGPIHVMWSDSDAMFLDMKGRNLAKLPRYAGDLELINHSSGSVTSEAEHKRWNRKNEILAAGAEASAVGASWLGQAYPFPRLDYAWRLLLGGQFHDIMAGTADANAYTYSWNDDIIASNQFSSVLTTATDRIASAMDTAGAGQALVVFNPLNIARQDPVAVTLPHLPAAVHVVGPDGRTVASQVDGDGKLVFIAEAPSMGYAVYHVVAGAEAVPTGLKVTPDSLENARYRIQLNKNGDVASIFDKQVGVELLSGPMRLSFQSEAPSVWPAWNMDWKDQAMPPRAYVAGPAQIKVVEDGAARVMLQITRDAQGSHFVQTVSLAAGTAGNRVVFGADVDWKTGGSALMADFPTTASNPYATYNWDIGTIQRDDDNPRKFEVPSHQWVDLSDTSGRFGVTMLTDVKNGSDKPDDNTLRLTLLYTPGLHNRNYSDQATQDWGHHNIVFGLASHAGTWRVHNDASEWQAYRLNEPLVAFTTPGHGGPLGRQLSLLRVSTPQVRVLAFKRAEDGKGYIVRLVELSGRQQAGVRIAPEAKVLAAAEDNAQEQPYGAPNGAFHVANGELVASFAPYQPRTFRLTLAPLAVHAVTAATAAVKLDYDLAAAIANRTASTSGYDGKGDSYPAAMLPRTIAYAGVRFQMGDPGGPDAVTAHGQTIALPAGHYSRLYLLASSSDGDQTADFKVGDATVPLEIENWTGFIGQWDYRDWSDHSVELPGRGGRGPRVYKYQLYAGLNPGYVKRAPLAWFASHHQLPDGTMAAYSYSYLFGYEINLPAGAHSVTLPDNPKIHIFAATVANDRDAVRPAQPLYDVLPYKNADKSLLYTQGSGPDAAFYRGN